MDSVPDASRMGTDRNLRCVHRAAAEGGARAWRYITRWDDVDLTEQR
jgi:hypothetical protein